MVTFYGKSFPSRLLIGTALYASPAIMQNAIRASGASIVTVRSAVKPLAARPAMRSGP